MAETMQDLIEILPGVEDPIGYVRDFSNENPEVYATVDERAGLLKMLQEIRVSGYDNSDALDRLVFYIFFGS